MTLVPIYDKNTIFFGDTYFKIKGEVKYTNITVTPNPQMFGAGDKKGGTQVMSESIQDSTVGGRGIFKNDIRTDVDRYWTSTCKTWFKEALTLPDLTVDMGKPAGLSTENLNLIWSYRNDEYFAFSNHVYRWLDVSNTWSALEYDLPTVPTDAIVFNSVLYVAYGSGYATRNAAGTWTNFAGTPASYFVVWDAKLYRMAQVAGLWTLFNLPVGGVWSAAVGTLPDDTTPNGLVVYRDASSALVIYVLTNSGLWAYDATNQRLLQTEIRFPPTSDTVSGAVYHDGKLYMSTGGLGLLAVQAGSQFIASPVGLDLEDGVPPEQNGSIVAMKPAYNEVVVLTDASRSVAAGLIDSGLGNPFEPHHWSSRSGAMTLWRFDGSWHHLWQSSTTLPGAALDVSSSYGKLRAYWSAHGHALYQALQSSTLNPRANPTVPSAPSGSHTTSWYPFGLETQLKIHGHLTLRTSGCSATETVEVYYAIADDTTSLDTAPWTKIATITTDGQHTIQLGGPQGQSAYYFRYRFDLSRGSTVTARPVIEFVSAEWMHVLPATYAFSVDVDLSESFHGKTPAQMLKTLSTFADHKRTPQLQLFSYQDQLDNTTRTHYARITRLSGASFTGASERHAGTVQLGIIAPYLEDAESAP